MYVYVHILCVNIYVYAYCVYVCMYVYLSDCALVSMCMFVRMYAYKFMFGYIHLYECLYMTIACISMIVRMYIGLHEIVLVYK